jgi:rhodanese-related sulfurtransferase
MVTSELPEVPAYFPKDAELNRQGATALSKLTKPKALSANAVNKELQRGAILLDVRSGQDFAAGHILGSLNIALSGQFASWAGILIELDTPIILLVDDQESLDETVTRLARIGMDSVIGYLEKGIVSWSEAGFELTQSQVISVNDLNEELKTNKELQILDVRRTSEYADGHIPGALNIPLAELSKRLQDIPQNKQIVLICASGYRSSIAKSLLEKNGTVNLINVLGGIKAWKSNGYNITSAPVHV